MWSEQALEQMFVFVFLHQSALWATQFLLTLPSPANSAKVVSYWATNTTKWVQKIHLYLKETHSSPAKGHYLCEFSYRNRLNHLAPASEMIFPWLLLSICGTLCLWHYTPCSFRYFRTTRKTTRTKSFPEKRSWHKQSYKARRGGRVQW